MLYDEMLNFCKKILCHQKLPHFVQSTNHLICPFHIMVDPRLNFLVYQQMGVQLCFMDEMLNSCKGILCHQKLPHFVQSTNHLIGTFHIMVDLGLNFLVYQQMGVQLCFMDEMLNSCKELLRHQKLPHFVESTNNLIGPFHVMVDPRLNILL